MWERRGLRTTPKADYTYAWFTEDINNIGDMIRIIEFVLFPLNNRTQLVFLSFVDTQHLISVVMKNGDKFILDWWKQGLYWKERVGRPQPKFSNEYTFLIW